jgi:UDP-4-amino-4,6-dideoxy-N-acetyl-beta-L-altrosamine N-acetyltransferase
MLRPADDADMEMILAWRNQEANRLSSNHAHVISPEEHQAWWQRTKADPSRRVLVFLQDDEPCGVASFFDIDWTARTGAWGFYLDGEGPRGKDLGTWIGLMQEGVAYAFDELGLQELTAEVLDGNPGVRAMNRRLGFVEDAPVQKDIDGRQLTVYPLRMTRATRRR